MTHKELMHRLQNACQLDSQQCSLMLSALQRIMAQAGVEQVPVTLPGLGTFTSHKHPEYIEEDPQTHQQTLCPPRITYRMQNFEDGAPIEPSYILEKQLSDQTQSSVEVTSRFMYNLIRLIQENLGREEEVEVHGIGTFRVVKNAQLDSQRISYVPDEQMRDMVNAPFSCFCPVPIDQTSAPAVAPEVKETEIPTPEEVQIAEPAEIKTPEAERPKTTRTMPKAPVMEDNSRIGEQIYPYRRQNSSSVLLYICMGLVVAACLALAFFIYSVDTEDNVIDAPVVAEAESIGEIDMPESEIFVEDSLMADSTVMAEADTANSVAANATPMTETVTDPKTEESKKAEETKTAQEPAQTEKAPKASADGLMKNTDGSNVTYVIKSGDRLTLIALKYYGDKCFWPYIYDANADRLKSPQVVSEGFKLVLPDPVAYGIDANDPESTRKAKNRGAQLLK